MQPIQLDPQIAPGLDAKSTALGPVIPNALTAFAYAKKTFRPLETFTVAALIYFVVITAFSVAARQLERRLAVSGESTVH